MKPNILILSYRQTEKRACRAPRSDICSTTCDACLLHVDERNGLILSNPLSPDEPHDTSHNCTPPSSFFAQMY